MDGHSCRKRFDDKGWRRLAGKERLAGVKERTRPGILPLTEDEACDHLKRALAGSEWSVMRGWHNFRHSFISACASKGIDQRLRLIGSHPGSLSLVVGLCAGVELQCSIDSASTRYSPRRRLGSRQLEKWQAVPVPLG